MRYFILIFSVWSLVNPNLKAQELSAEQAITKVFRVLSGEEKNIPLNIDSLLQNGAWEALAYLDRSAGFQLSESDLQEAVPDYYRFKKGRLLFKLIDAEDHNQFGYEGELSYELKKHQLSLIDPKTGKERDRWTVLYLDDQYLALEMGELRVFFTHTPPLEP